MAFAAAAVVNKVCLKIFQICENLSEKGGKTATNLAIP